MRHRKLRSPILAALVLAACLAAAVALAAPVTVAQYHFTTRSEVAAFPKVTGQKCSKGHRKGRALGIVVGEKTNACAYRSPVLGDSSGGANLQITANVNLSADTPDNLQKKVYLAVSSRSDAASGYQLRVYPAAREWQLMRDPAGSAGRRVMAHGSGKFIRLGVGKLNTLQLRTFGNASGNEVQVLAKINRKVVFSKLDVAGGTPTGRQAAVVLGAKGDASARGASGVFDDVSIAVPNPNA